MGLLLLTTVILIRSRIGVVRVFHEETQSARGGTVRIKMMLVHLMKEGKRIEKVLSVHVDLNNNFRYICRFFLFFPL